MGNKIDMTNQVIKNWLVLEESKPLTQNTAKSIWWKCQCVKCGYQKVFNGSELRLNRVGEHNCNINLKPKVPKIPNTTIKDETNNQYGLLTVIDLAYCKDGFAYWNCKCKCGNTKVVRGNSLRNGSVTSCGCQLSKGENFIQQYFLKNKIDFQKEVSFEDLKDKGRLRFDFGIYKDKQLLGLIEFQGKQHYELKYRGRDTKDLQYHDKMKVEYCKTKNIPLLILNNYQTITQEIERWLAKIF